MNEPRSFDVSLIVLQATGGFEATVASNHRSDRRGVRGVVRLAMIRLMFKRFIKPSL